MRLVYIVVSGLLLTGLAWAPVHGDQAEGQSAGNVLERLWHERIGAPMPSDVNQALATLQERMNLDEAAGLAGAQKQANADDATTLGDVWSVCLSASGGCSVVDASGTFSPDCEHLPIEDEFLWIYATQPAVLGVTAAGDAVGVWNAYTMDENGTYESGTLTGNSCVVFNEPNIVVVRTNGVAEFTF